MRVRQHTRLSDDRGQAVPLALVAVAIAVVVTFAVASLGRSVVDAGRARTAADAAALAGVEGGRAASARLAAEHGAALVSWSSSGPGDALTVTVTVRVGRARASAAASNRGSAAIETGSGRGQARNRDGGRPDARLLSLQARRLVDLPRIG